MGDIGAQRRLATILAADVVGYSKLMAQDEEATIRTLRSHREIIDRLITRHDGRIFNTAGDAVLAEFSSAVEAVRCAISIQDELRVRNAELIAERQMLFRIGVNVGDVVVQDGDFLGDGVNIAARLEGIAEPGGVCISGSTFEQVKNKLSVGFKDLGPQEVKNIPEPVSAFSITSAPVSVIGESRAPGKATPTRPRHRNRNFQIAALAAAVAVVGISGGTIYWQSSDHGIAPLSSFPENFSTDDMDAEQIESLMAGMTISGKRAIDNQPFSIVLNADKTASYTFGGSGNISGRAINYTGEWWTGDFQFCMRIPKFAFGQKACPTIIKHGSKVSAVRPVNGEELPWTLSK